MARDDDEAPDDGDDDVIHPDGVTSGRRQAGGGFGFDDLDELAERAVDSVLHLVRRANALAGGVLILAVVASIGGFALGLVALSGGIRTVWIALGGFFAVVAIGTVLTAMLRLRTVRKGADGLVTEVRQLIGGGSDNEQVVIDTVASTEDNKDDGIVQLSREFFSMKGAIGNRVGQFRQLAGALTAVTSFPGLVAIATLVSFAFLGLGLIFLISLAL